MNRGQPNDQQPACPASYRPPRPESRLYKSISLRMRGCEEDSAIRAELHAVVPLSHDETPRGDAAPGSRPSASGNPRAVVVPGSSNTRGDTSPTFLSRAGVG